ncbi:MAG TPA: stage II sporulation protein M [Gemmatimonadaceae bacterium]
MTRNDALQARNPAGLEDVVAIETPEMTLVSYTSAGVGSRVAAALIDLLICIASFVALWLLLWLIGDDPSHARTPQPTPSGMWVFAILILIQFAIMWGYYVVFEALNDGQTPGKKIMKLRVVMDGGYSVPFSASAIRNIVRLLDMQPGLFAAVGIVSIAASRTGKRIGDFVAGTMVVRERPLTAALPEKKSTGSPATAVTSSSVLNDAEYDVLSRFITRRSAIAADDRSRLAARLAERFHTRLRDVSGVSDIARLIQLHEHETAARARGGAAHRSAGAAREKHAIVAQGAERWATFAMKLTVAQKHGIKDMSESELRAFVADYREISNDLARLRTATRGSDPAAVFALSRLAAGAHNLIYRRKGLSAARIGEYLTWDVPREVRRSVRPILVAAVLFFGPMAIAYRAASSSPAIAAEILPASMMERAEDGIQRARANRGYIEDPKAARPVMGSFIITNNIQVAFAVFAFGITVLGTVYALVSNGAMIGGVLGLYQNKGIIKLLLAFVAPHSVLELSAITIAGGAGLLIAAAVILPGNRTRREALIENGKRAMSLIACVIMFLLVAGSLEGLVSPIPNWPLSWKVSFAILSLFLMLAYLSLGYRKRTYSSPRDLISR